MRRLGVAVALAGLLLALASAARGSTAPPPGVTGPDCPSRVAAFYYGWYGGSPGWRHWATATDDPNYAHDPNKVVASGPQYPGGVRRDIASTDYPTLGPYDSHSRAVVDQHLRWAATSGIDVLISSWWGPQNYEDASLGLLVDRIEARRSPVRASVYLETWNLFHGHPFSADFASDPRNFDPASRSQIRQTAASWLAYVVKTYGARRGLTHVIKNGRRVPVIFVYTAALFAPEEWQAIFDDVRAATGTDAYYQGDVEGADFSGLARVFDGVHVYQPAPFTAQGALAVANRVVDPHAAPPNSAAPITDLATIGADYNAWAIEARALGRGWAATVIPGFDDRRIRNPSFVVSRNHGDGRTYDWFWSEALSTRPDWVLITSFNEWHEGSEIEPSVEYGNEFLRRTRAWTQTVRRCPPPAPVL